ncbi:aldehyde dehydrogenase family protein [Staphylococcus aureus]
MNLVNGDGAGVGNPLSEHPKVRMMSFTGSALLVLKLWKKPLKILKRYH